MSRRWLFVLGLLVGLAAVAGVPWLLRASGYGGRRAAFTERLHSPITSLAISPDGETLAVATGNRDVAGEIALFRLRDRQRQRTFAIEFDNPVWSVAWSPDGKLLASGGQDNLVKLWRAADGKLVASWRQPDDPVHPDDRNLREHGVQQVAFSPDGRWLASASWTSVWLWQLADRSLRLTLHDRRALLPYAGFSADSAKLATRHRNGSIELVSVPGGERLASIPEAEPGLCMALSPDARLVASCEANGGVKLLELPQGRQVGSLRGHESGTYRALLSPDGTMLATAGVDDGIEHADFEEPLSAPKLWRVDSRELAARFHLSLGMTRALAFSPDGKWLASGTDEQLDLWRLP